MRRSLRTRLTVILIGLAVGPLLVVGAILAWLNFGVQQEQALTLQREMALRVATQVEAFFTELEDQLLVVSKIQEFKNLDRVEQENNLLILLGYQDVFGELVVLDGQGHEQARVSRESLALTALSDRTEADEFVIPKTTGEVYYSPVRFNETTGEPLMTVAVPQVDILTGELNAVLVADVRIKSIWDLLGTTPVGLNQSVYIVDSGGRVVAHRDPSVVLGGAQFNAPAQDGFMPGLTGAQSAVAVARIQVGQQEFNIVVEQEVATALALAFNTVYIFAGIILVTLAVAAALGWAVVRQTVRPIQALAAAAQAISAGDLSARVKVTGQDESGQTALAFNAMAQEVQATRASLEQRVVDRTRALALSSDLSRRLSTLLDRRQLVAEVVEQLQQTFNYYHVHMYLWDEAHQNLVMVGGTGEAGRVMLSRGHQIPRGRGLVGRAAEANLPVLVPDTVKDPKWLPNPLLPDTRAEVAVPIVVGDRVLGVLDVQHNLVNGLQQDDTELIQSVANQVAIALQNIRAYEQVRQQAERGELINVISQRIQSATDVDNALQIAVREVGRALGAPRVSVRLKTSAGGKNGDQSNSTEEAR